jgi:hypothetical protein
MAGSRPERSERKGGHKNPEINPESINLDKIDFIV